MVLPGKFTRLFLLLGFVLASALVFGQGKPGASTGGNTNTPSTPTRPPGPARSTPPLTEPQATRPILLSGRVMIDDGTPVTKPVAINRVCGTRVVHESYTDSHGYFSFYVGQQTRDFVDASMSGPDFTRPTDPNRGESTVSERDLWTCELRADFSGFRSDSIVLAGHTWSDPNVGNIVLHRRGKVEGTTVSVTSLKAPKEAKKALEKARKLMAKKRLDEARQQLEQAVGSYPQYAEAWVALGEIYQQSNRAADAQKAFEQALAADSRYIAPYFDLAVLAAQANQWQRVAELTDKALALNSYDYAAIHFYNAAAYFNLHNVDRAEKSARSARRLDSQYRIPAIDLLLGEILTQRQDYTGAADEFRSFLKYSPNGVQAEQARAQLATIEDRHPSDKP